MTKALQASVQEYRANPEEIRRLDVALGCRCSLKELRLALWRRGLHATERSIRDALRLKDLQIPLPFTNEAGELQVVCRRQRRQRRSR